MRYSSIKPNDSINGEGVCVSLFVQGCEGKCPDCFNKETWNFNGGKPFGGRELQYIKRSLTANGIKRNFSILGGEPLHSNNIKEVTTIINEIKTFDNSIKIYVWTGYLYEDLLKKYGEKIFKNIDVLIDGRFEMKEKDVTLKLRGSSNQRIIDVPKTLKEHKVVLLDI
ncbi:MAG: anaerobic ribonucleoside-triphosphate reductase activating protein [Intestinibacter bartlettii]|jgi:anaerobic ribonucleoside-triphosphate reductase activating protein|nr:anaerobic ribonucleoside-triphosphate reductase activating protein [Intestinibacter bartlettii]